MAKKCIPCLGMDVKEAIRGLGDKKLNTLLDKIADCDGDREVQLCTSKTKGTRAPSEYNLFIGECMKRENAGGEFKKAPAAMKKCATEWRSRKNGV